MIFVDDLGWTWPGIHHTPWNGLHLADLAMPFFLWLVGFSVITANSADRFRHCSLAVGETVILMTPPPFFISLLKHLIKVEGGAAE